MKLLSIKGNFGCLDEKEIYFKDSLNIFYMPNESGKTTLCSFVRIMLYGLDTSKRDSKLMLSDKNRYLPYSNKKMFGELRILYEDRIIKITRFSGKSGIMQDFSAVYEDTGETITHLNAKNCGQVLTGISEECFISSAFINAADISNMSDELSEKLMSLSLIGDSKNAYSKANGILDTAKNAIKSRTKSNSIVEAEKKYNNILRDISRIAEIEDKIEELSCTLASRKSEVDRISAEYEQVFAIVSRDVNQKREYLETIKRKSSKKLSILSVNIIDEQALENAKTHMYEYNMALKAFRQAKADLELSNNQYKIMLSELETEKAKYLENQISRSKIKVKWWAVFLGLFLAVSAAATTFIDADVGGLSKYFPYILSLFAIISIVIAFIGGYKEADKDEHSFNYNAEKEKLDIDIFKKEQLFSQASKNLNSITNSFLDIAKPICNSMDADECILSIQKADKQLSEYKMETETLSSVIKELNNLSKTQHDNEGEDKLARLSETMLNARGRYEDVIKEISRLEGELNTIGDKASILSKRDEFRKIIEALEFELSAISEAKNALSMAHEKLRLRMSPEICTMAQEYLSIMTNNRYDNVELSHGFDVKCSSKRRVMEPLDILRLSTGTKDQLYLALRLAVCNTLNKSNVQMPILIDDLLLTFDDERTNAALFLLKKLSKERQIILFSCRRLNYSS